jgi:radical SAM protein with 4Fe4S-binding SPASM domain
VSVVFGVTLSSYNVGRFAEMFDACAREVPGLTAQEVHLNVAQVSGHYYGNEAAGDVRPEAALVRQDLRARRALGGRPRSAGQALEHLYLRYLERFLRTGRTPMPCHALRASCFVDPSGVVYPCVTYSRPVGQLRETGMRLEPIWAAPETRWLQREIWNGECPQCWTACEAYQSILGNLPAGRWRARPGRAVLPSRGVAERTR